MKIAISKTRERFPLSKKKILKKTVASTLRWSMVLFFVYALFIIYFAQRGWAGIVATGIFSFLVLYFFLDYLYQRWYFAVYFYDLTDDYIVIRKNPITPVEITVTYERIQDIYVDQDILDRIFGLYDVHLASATISSAIEAHIDGVEKQAAEGLRAELLKKIQDKMRGYKGQTALPTSI